MTIALPPLTTALIHKAESYPGIKAGVARLEEILSSPSYSAAPEGVWVPRTPEAKRPRVTWPHGAKSILVLALHHPTADLPLDWWDGTNTMGNRRLIEISMAMAQWMNTEHGLHALPLPYHLESGGLFLKDAAGLAGLGVIGRNNLLLNPEWGPRLRLRAILIVEALAPSNTVHGFSPCASCDNRCHAICPHQVFSDGSYHRPSCIEQLAADMASNVPGTIPGKCGNTRLVSKTCRACELVCPVGRGRPPESKSSHRGDCGK